METPQGRGPHNSTQRLMCQRLGPQLVDTVTEKRMDHKGSDLTMGVGPMLKKQVTGGVFWGLHLVLGPSLSASAPCPV